MGRLRIDPLDFSHATLIDVATESELREFLGSRTLPDKYYVARDRLMESPIEVVPIGAEIKPREKCKVDRFILGALNELREDVLKFRYWSHFRDLRAVAEGVANSYFGAIHNPPGIISVNFKGVHFAHPRDYFRHVYLRHPKDIASADPKYPLPGFGTKLAGIRFLDKLPASACPLDPLQGFLKIKV